MFKIEDYKQAIEKICKDLRVKHLDLVGSASRTDFQPEKSDIDLLVVHESDQIVEGIPYHSAQLAIRRPNLSESPIAKGLHRNSNDFRSLFFVDPFWCFHFTCP